MKTLFSLVRNGSVLRQKLKIVFFKRPVLHLLRRRTTRISAIKTSLCCESIPMRHERRGPRTCTSRSVLLLVFLVMFNSIVIPVSANGNRIRITEGSYPQPSYPHNTVTHGSASHGSTNTITHKGTDTSPNLDSTTSANARSHNSGGAASTYASATTAGNVTYGHSSTRNYNRKATGSNEAEPTTQEVPLMLIHLYFLQFIFLTSENHFTLAKWWS